MDFSFFNGAKNSMDFGKFGSNTLCLAVTLLILGSYAILALNEELQL
jgi:hypothetical protein